MRLMMMLAPSLRLFAHLALAASALGLGACTPVALSPPARTLPLESAATLEEGDVAVQASGGYHDTSGGDIGSAALRARIGLVPHLEAQLEATYAHVGYGDERSPHLGAGRLGLKVAPIEHIALVAGIGAGAHSYGAFAAPDAGVIFAYENPYVVPWIALRGWVSLPIDPSIVTVTRTAGDGTVDMFVLVPPNTAAWQLSTGVRVPIALDAERGIRMNLLAGGGIGELYGLDGQARHGIFHFESGLEIVVDP
ncbi:MAG: hypothetical protein M3Y87_15440 [Myxococcota bacterium]|nr:hypothetical protein [Myxococcota bacterium]